MIYRGDISIVGKIEFENTSSVNISSSYSYYFGLMIRNNLREAEILISPLAEFSRDQNAVQQGDVLCLV